MINGIDERTCRRISIAFHAASRRMINDRTNDELIKMRIINESIEGDIRTLLKIRVASRQ